ncbi:MAG: Rpn family recombination-promoting nuclease/putative transposase [Hespellia sp.]|nr:Rpn family recombination-promoting nuclease/putative transposase [Hespellia sp.]
MGKADDGVVDFMADPVRYADVVNHGLFAGNPVIDPLKLSELDSVSREIPGIQKIRDIKRLYKDEAIFLVIGVEAQMHIHYAMPLRNLIYDAQTYEGQRKKIAKQHTKDKDLKLDEWLSSFSREDKLLPVITLVVYYGTEPWDGPRTLHEMLAVSKELAVYQPLMMNYQLNLLEVMKIQNLDTYSDDLKMVFGFVKYQKDKEALWEFVNQNQELFTNVPLDTCRAIEAVANTKEITEYMSREKEKEEGVNVCEALRGIREDGREEGREEGAIGNRIELIRKKKQKNLDIKTIAEHVEESEEFVGLISQLIEENPTADTDELIKKYEAHKKAD